MVGTLEHKRKNGMSINSLLNVKWEPEEVLLIDCPDLVKEARSAEGIL